MRSWHHVVAAVKGALLAHYGHVSQRDVFFLGVGVNNSMERFVVFLLFISFAVSTC